MLDVPLRSSLNDLQVLQQEWTCATHFFLLSLGWQGRDPSDWLVGLVGLRIQITFEVEVAHVNSSVELGG